MHKVRRVNDAVHWYMSGLGARVVAASGRASDTHHLGELILRALREAPDHILQIDGATDRSETNRSVLERVVRCATAMRNLGLRQGDVMVLMAPNHLDLAIPLYAALCVGVVVAPVDRTLTVKELSGSFSVSEPRLVFCESERAPDVQCALNRLELDARILTFDTGDYLTSFQQFLNKYSDDTKADDFRASELDPATTLAMLIPTSGTTGLPKAAAVTHQNFAITTPYIWCRYREFPTPTRLFLVGSPLQWLTAIVNFLLSPLLRYCRLQSSLPLTPEHAAHLINKYRPSFTVFSPTLMTTLLKAVEQERCDLSCFETILLGGSAVPQDLIDQIKEISPGTEAFNVFGMTELTSVGFSNDDPPAGSCGKPLGCFEYRLVNVETQEDITEPDTPGELWMKGPGIFQGYYRNSAATAEAFSEGWLRTGDLFYRDQHWNFYFVERIKLLLKYKSHHISPVELEGVIRQLGGVADVAVTGVADTECGELPVACVVRRAGEGEGGAALTADDVKRVVAENLSEAKQLRGGVVFLPELPVTASTKIHRRRLREMVAHMHRE